MIEPHGNKLINRQVDPGERKEWLEYARSRQAVRVDERVAADLELIATGAYSPLEGFMRREDYDEVVRNMRLTNGLAWSLPITLPVDTDEAKGLTWCEDIALVNSRGEPLALLHVEDIYSYDKNLEADRVFKTRDQKHPGVARLYEQGQALLGGKIWYLSDQRLPSPLRRYHLTPEQTRRHISERGWQTVVAFQTRNPIHRSHEYIQKCALELVDGLLVHPLVGETKSDDIPAEVRLRCYEALLENYYPPSRTLLSVFPAAMRYAGPREAIFHAIVRKNYGATHFIVGRDHAGVGSYYGTYDAQRIFSEFDAATIGITPLFFDHTFYCKDCGQVASDKTCNHQNGARVLLSGTKVREFLRAGKPLPMEFTRPEISRILVEAYQQQAF